MAWKELCYQVPKPLHTESLLALSRDPTGGTIGGACSASAASGPSGPGRHCPKKSPKFAEDKWGREQGLDAAGASCCCLTPVRGEDAEALDAASPKSAKMASQSMSPGVAVAAGATADDAVLAELALACEDRSWFVPCTVEGGACASEGRTLATTEEDSEGDCLGAHSSCSYFFLQSSTRSSFEAAAAGLAALQAPPYVASATAFPERCIWAISSGPQRYVPVQPFTFET